MTTFVSRHRCRRPRAALSRIGAPLLGLVALIASPGLPTASASLPHRAAVRPMPTTHAGVVASSCADRAAVRRWSLARRVAQLIVVPVEENDLNAALPEVRHGIGGLILLGSAAPPTLGTQLRALTAAAPRHIKPFVMADEEGGGVQRIANLVGSLPWPRTMAATLTTTQVRGLAKAVARKMVSNGVTMDLAPVLDLAAGPGPDAQHTDGPRSFSPDAATATAFGLAFAEGMLDGGVLPVVKHFPGEGQASGNSDLGPATTPPLSKLEQSDLVPFEAAIRANLPAVMVGNATIPGLGSGAASLSRAAITGLLRHQLGFHGLILTDSLSADAISDAGIGVAAASERAVAAGADMVLFNSATPNTETALITAALVQAVQRGTISLTTLNNAVLSVLRAKHVSLCRT